PPCSPETLQRPVWAVVQQLSVAGPNLERVRVLRVSKCVTRSVYHQRNNCDGGEYASMEALLRHRFQPNCDRRPAAVRGGPGWRLRCAICGNGRRHGRDRNRRCLGKPANLQRHLALALPGQTAMASAVEMIVRQAGFVISIAVLGAALSTV